MAEKNPQTRQPSKARNFYSSSTSNSAKSQNSNKPFTNSKFSHTNSNSSRSRKATTSNWENADNNVVKDDGGLQGFPTLVGTCPFMCPEEEMVRREKLRDLAIFERLHGNPAKSSANLAVKKFCRTITTRDLKASDVRPVSVLEDTLNYLFNLLNSSECPFEVIHDFIFDRTRCIRQDLSMQNATGDQVIHIYERMIKFHIISHHHLHKICGNPNISSMSHLNMEQLMKTLTTLFNLYEANRASQSICRNEAEFHSFYVLLHLGLNNHDSESLSLWFLHVPALIIKSKEMCFARKILRCYRLGNYKRFISTVEEEASNLQYCIVEPYVNEVRILALSCISYGGYKLQPYALSHLSKLLMMKESDVESLCLQCGLEISTSETEKGLSCAKPSVTHKPARGFEKYYPMNSERIERLFGELSAL
ncbi:SAC3 family protein C [Primulina tabacum]|uniref:SAC3 family protein C n=1 Tax=Primulina tabacum TaxID=48773 RepID=UPI003F5AB342